jgi:hypothetical protein
MRRCLQRRIERVRIALVSRVNWCRDDHAGIEIDRMLGLAGQPGWSVLHPGDLGIWINRALPIDVR